MKKLSIAFASLAMLSTAAFAGDRCMPSTGNWINAATQSCPDQGSGGVGNNSNAPVIHVCEPKGKRS